MVSNLEITAPVMEKWVNILQNSNFGCILFIFICLECYNWSLWIYCKNQGYVKYRIVCL